MQGHVTARPKQSPETTGASASSFPKSQLWSSPSPKLDTHSCVLGLMHPPFAVAALGRASIPGCRNN